MSSKKREWTEESAKNYVKRVESRREPKGLKYCSALDFLLKRQ